MLNIETIRTIEDMKRFLKAADMLLLQAEACREKKAEWIRSILIRLKYVQLGRNKKGLIRTYLKKMTAYSGAQLTRHIGAYKMGIKLCMSYERHTFPVKYTREDHELLAETDNLHGRLNGAATQKICAAMYACNDRLYKRLANISVSHLYRLRKTSRYKEEALEHERTNPVRVPIGERCKPEPNGMPGFIRVDSVHQGDKDREKGVYHINLVDEVTQWEVVIAVNGISEYFLIPALKNALTFFPFRIINFHSDNGSEYINKTVARLLNKLLIRQTKSRPRHSNDNGLVESKNGAIVRKYLGHAHIPHSFASRINTFYIHHLIPYINFHRPSAFPHIEVLPNGKKKITYPHKNYATPFQKFLSLKTASQYLRPGLTLEMLRSLSKQKLLHDFWLLVQ